MEKTPPGETVLDEIAASVGHYLKQQGFEDTKANEAGAGAAEAVRFTFGGNPIYIPSLLKEKVRRRNEELAAAFTGDNHAALARQYGLTVIHVYRILQNMREQRRAAAKPILQIKAG